jgi:hypothetical protein
MKRFLLTFLLLLSASFYAYAQNVEVKGVGTIQYEGGMFSKDPSDSDKKNVLESAKVSAWKNYVASANGAKQKMLMNNVGANAASIEKFITGYQIIDQKVDPNLKTYTVLVRVGFNSGLVDQFLESETVGAGASSTSASRSKDSLFSFLFMSRKATSIRQFDARKTQIQEASTSASADDNGGVTARSTKTTGGSTMRKEDDVNYAVTSSQDMDSAMGEVLNTANIEYAGYDDIVANCRAPAVSQFKNEFVSNDELAPQTRSKDLKALLELLR